MKKLIFVSIIISFSCGCLRAQAPVSIDSTTRAKKGDSTWVKVEQESEFPGGVPGWTRFLSTHLEYPSKAIRKNIQGTVLLQFIVEKDGSISNIEALSGPDLLQAAALDVIRQSPRWVPAMQDGRKVKSYKKQPISFRLESDKKS